MPDDQLIAEIALAAWWGCGFTGRAYWKHRRRIGVIGGDYLDLIDCVATGLFLGPVVWLLGFLDRARTQARSRLEPGTPVKEDRDD